ncbi:hypothetical protein SSX86_028648 [Deinandra increscens subsp. villosa]|uniref:F-box domain-containing protein n=1 Tax=Deinandra increscens subsp. villosa TaxID=3103831 RepID=A0AAP0GLK1_9ASTR
METRSAKRRKLRNPNYSSENYTGDDRITDLPDAILHHILLLLPIKSIVQTSILSKRWRTLWYTFPDLDFTTIIPPGTDYFTKNANLKNLVNGNVITRILSLRDNLSDVRTLRFHACMSFSGLQTLIRKAVRLRVQELDIRVETSDTINFPRSIITHDCLRVLKMKAYAGFRLPPSRLMRSAFQTLETLSLSYVNLSNQSSVPEIFTDCSFPQLKTLHLKSCYDFNYLRVGCRLLEELVIKRCSLLQGLEILSPRLVTLNVSSCFGAYSIYNTWFQIDAPRLHTLIWVDNRITSKNSMQNLVCLHEATVGFHVTQQDLSAERLQSLSSFLSGLSHAVFLTLERQFVEIMSKNDPLVAVFFNPFVKVNSLELQTSEVLCLASVLKACPFVPKLIIKITNSYKRERRRNRLSWDLSSSWEEKHWESQTRDLKPLLHNLKVVKIQGFSEYDISLVKFLLLHGKVLQDLILYFGEDNSRGYPRHEKLKSRIMGFPRGSADAKLAFH